MVKMFLYSSSVYSRHVLMLSASARSMLFMSFIMPISDEMFPWYLFLLKRSLVFFILLFSSVLCTDHRGSLSYLSLLFFGTLHSDGYIFPFHLRLLLLFFSQLFVRPFQTTILPFLYFFFLGMVLIIACCTMFEPLYIVV